MAASNNQLKHATDGMDRAVEQTQAELNDPKTNPAYQAALDRQKDAFHDQQQPKVKIS
jgi:hypothetical protein